MVTATVLHVNRTGVILPMMVGGGAGDVKGRRSVIYLRAIIASVLAFASAPLSASNWYFVDIGGKKPGRMVFYMDKESIALKGVRSRVWLQVYYENRADGVGSSKQLREFDCAEHTSRTVSFVNYAPSGMVVASKSNGEYSPLSPIVPDTIGESEFTFACGKIDEDLHIGAIENIEKDAPRLIGAMDSLATSTKN